MREVRRVGHHARVRKQFHLHRVPSLLDVTVAAELEVASLTITFARSDQCAAQAVACAHAKCKRECCGAPAQSHRTSARWRRPGTAPRRLRPCRPIQAARCPSPGSPARLSTTPTPDHAGPLCSLCRGAHPSAASRTPGPWTSASSCRGTSRGCGRWSCGQRGARASRSCSVRPGCKCTCSGIRVAQRRTCRKTCQNRHRRTTESRRPSTSLQPGTPARQLNSPLYDADRYCALRKADAGLSGYRPGMTCISFELVTMWRRTGHGCQPRAARRLASMRVRSPHQSRPRSSAPVPPPGGTRTRAGRL